MSNYITSSATADDRNKVSQLNGSLSAQKLVWHHGDLVDSFTSTSGHSSFNQTLLKQAQIVHSSGFSSSDQYAFRAFVTVYIRVASVWSYRPKGLRRRLCCSVTSRASSVSTPVGKTFVACSPPLFFSLYFLSLSLSVTICQINAWNKENNGALLHRKISHLWLHSQYLLWE